MVPKIGYARLRAMELLKTLFMTISKINEGIKLVSPLLRSKVIRCMLHMIKTYPLNNCNHQQCIHILNCLKTSLDK